MLHTIAFLGPVGTQELVVILVIALLLFGAKKVPEMMKSVGQGVREFRKSSREIMREFEQETMKPAPRRTIPPPSASNSRAVASDDSADTGSKDVDADKSEAGADKKDDAADSKDEGPAEPEDEHQN